MTISSPTCRPWVRAGGGLGCSRITSRWPGIGAFGVRVRWGRDSWVCAGCVVGVGLRGTEPALAGRRRGLRLSRCARWVFWCLPSMLAPARSRCRLGCAGWFRWLRDSWVCFRSGRRVWVRFALGRALGHVLGVCLCGTAPALAGRRRGLRLSRCARGFLVFAFNARSGSLPLPLWGALSGSLMNRCVTGGS